MSKCSTGDNGHRHPYIKPVPENETTKSRIVRTVRYTGELLRVMAYVKEPNGIEKLVYDSNEKL